MKQKILSTLLSIALVMVPGSAQAAGPGDRGPEVVAVQEDLASAGYVVEVDGYYGPRTARAVRHFQRASGLLVDGVAGPVTSSALDNGVTATAPATRGKQVQIAAPPVAPPPVEVGIYLLPFAPAGLSACAEMMFYARQFGLPAQFEGIGWRESNCRNEDIVRTSCCHGYWQMHRIHFESGKLGEKCEAWSYQDVNSATPLERQKQACAAGDLYARGGLSHWSATS